MMKLFLSFIFLVICLSAHADLKKESFIQNRGSELHNQRIDASLLENYGEALLSMREGLVTLKTPNEKIQDVVDESITALDAILVARDVRRAGALLPLVNLLYASKATEDSQLKPNVSNQDARIILNYFIDGAFTNEILIASESVSDNRLGEMLRFYAGNPSQTSEGSWRTNGTMLFVFGHRLVDYLASQDQERIAAFFHDVQIARQDKLSGPGPDESPASEDNQPTTEEMKTYEDAFNRLEVLVKTKSLPAIKMPDLKGQHSSVELPQKSTSAPSEPKKIASTSPELELDKERSPFTLWGVIFVLVVASLGFLWFRLKKGR